MEENFSPMKHKAGDKARLERIMKEFQRGFRFLKKFQGKRTVTIFGSHLMKEDSFWYQEARKLGEMLAQNNIVVATGGGPGIMEAANRGAKEAGGLSVGLGIELNSRETQNAYTTDAITFYYFFVRKVMLARIAQVFVFFPGAFGTLDEFMEISVLKAKKKFHREIPLILVGKDYWQSLIDWFQKVPQEKYGVFQGEEEDLKIWSLVDNAKEAFELIKSKIPETPPSSLKLD
jgi:uncharacterized protein (TIGR00730 family)